MVLQSARCEYALVHVLLAEPVHTAVLILIDAVAYGVERRRILLVLLQILAPLCHVTVACPVRVGVASLKIGIDIFGQTRLLEHVERAFPTYVEVVVEVEFGLVLGAFCSYENHTTGSTRTVNG